MPYTYINSTNEIFCLLRKKNVYMHRVDTLIITYKKAGQYFVY